MKAVVLAAGKGTRLRPLTDDKPKGLVEVDGRPIVTHCFERLAELGAEEFVVVVGYRKEDIIEHYGDEWEGIPITYTHQREQKGLAHALLTAEELIDDPFMLILGDNIFEANLADLSTARRSPAPTRRSLSRRSRGRRPPDTASVTRTVTARSPTSSKRPRTHRRTS